MFTDAKTFTLLSAVLLAGVEVANAHGHIVSWDFGGESHAGFNPSYPPELGSTATRPSDNSDQGFTDYTIGKVACGGASAGSGTETWDLNAGESVTAVWNTWPESHKGPVTEYMAACPDSGCDGVDAASLTWFKIQEDDFDGTAWPTESIASTRKYTFKIPTDLAAGPYLVRHDIIAMHTTGAPQVYPYCFQANLISSGSVIPSVTTTFPAAYKLNTDFLTWSLYGGDQNAFVPPGPAVYNAAGGGGDDTPAPPPVSSPAPVVSSSSAAPVTSSAAVVISSSASGGPSSSAAVSSSADSAPSSSSAAGPIPVPSSSGPGPAPTSSAAGPAPTDSGPGTVELGGALPPVSQSGDRWVTLGGSYQDQNSAYTAACMEQMNRCKRWANALPNSEVSAGMTLCDTQDRTCEASSPSTRRGCVVKRYGKRNFRVL